MFAGAYPHQARRHAADRQPGEWPWHDQERASVARRDGVAQSACSRGDHDRVRTFDELVAEADAVDVSGWGFDWLEGRGTEERPPWGYTRLLAQRLPEVASALDIDTGGGEV